jgi:hypothetical protein
MYVISNISYLISNTNYIISNIYYLISITPSYNRAVAEAMRLLEKKSGNSEMSNRDRYSVIMSCHYVITSLCHNIITS